MSARSYTIALDTMGGDYAPYAVLAGADRVLEECSDIHFLLFGDEAVLNPDLDLFPKLRQASDIIHTERVIASDEKPSVALRQGKDSSMRLAIDSVKNGLADAVVSAGNTGALMGMSKLVFRTLEGIDRPAIASIFPTKTGRLVFLDLGANVDCNEDHLVQFALMGDAFARVIFGIESPKIGILNVGSEEMKGHDSVKNAAELLRKHYNFLNFYGFVEGNDIAQGTVDVVVTDGFTGNVALKTAEGVADICREYLRQALKRSWLTKIGALLVANSMRRVFKKMDPRLHNGAMFVGLNGIAVKSHGGSDALGNANAIKVAYKLVKHRINEKIIHELGQRTNLQHDTQENVNV